MHINNIYEPEIIVNILCYSDTSCSSVCKLFHRVFFPAFLDNCRNSFWLKEHMFTIDKDVALSNQKKIQALHQAVVNKVEQIGEKIILKKTLKGKAFSVADLNHVERCVKDSSVSVVNLFHHLNEQCPYMNLNLDDWPYGAFDVKPALTEERLIKKIQWLFKQTQLMRDWMKEAQLLPNFFNRLILKYQDYVVSGCQPRLPKEIGLLKGLTLLDIAHNNLEELPPEIGQLTELRGFRAGHNKLTTLPPEIGQLKRLTFFFLDHNPIKELPQEMKQLTQLRLFTIGYANGTAEQIAQLPFTRLGVQDAYS